MRGAECEAGLVIRGHVAWAGVVEDGGSKPGRAGF